jgi:hypothetical protein
MNSIPIFYYLSGTMSVDTFGHFSTSTLQLTNFFTSDLDETLQKDALDHQES